MKAWLGRERTEECDDKGSKKSLDHILNPAVIYDIYHSLYSIPFSSFSKFPVLFISQQSCYLSIYPIPFYPSSFPLKLLQLVGCEFVQRYLTSQIFEIRERKKKGGGGGGGPGGFFS